MHSNRISCGLTIEKKLIETSEGQLSLYNYFREAVCGSTNRILSDILSHVYIFMKLGF